MIYLSLHTYNLLNINAVNVEFCLTALSPFPSTQINKKKNKLTHIIVRKENGKKGMKTISRVNI